MKYLALALLTLFLAAQPWLVPGLEAAPPQQQPRCRAFAETGGFTVCDDDQARFLTAFERWGLQRIGYPISGRYEHGGFVSQAFQKAIMQWRPESGDVALVNIFDDLHTAGYDETLFEAFQTPRQLPPGWDGNRSFQEIVRNRQALLDVRPALRNAYFAVGEPLTFFGLPTSEVRDMGNHYAIRLQRAVLQEWKEAVPWAGAGEVTIANGGDIARQAGALPAAALQPESGARVESSSGSSEPALPPPAPEPVNSGPCDPSYPGVCIPPPPPDLDCGQIAYDNFRVVGPDPHRFDGDDDGIGCER